MYIVLIQKYMQIHAIPEYSDIPTHTCNTDKYMQYIHIVTYLHIHAIQTKTCNTYS